MEVNSFLNFDYNPLKYTDFESNFENLINEYLDSNIDNTESKYIDKQLKSFIEFKNCVEDGIKALKIDNEFKEELLQFLRNRALAFEFDGDVLHFEEDILGEEIIQLKKNQVKEQELQFFDGYLNNRLAVTNRIISFLETQKSNVKETFSQPDNGPEETIAPKFVNPENGKKLTYRQAALHFYFSKLKIDISNHNEVLLNYGFSVETACKQLNNEFVVLRSKKNRIDVKTKATIKPMKKNLQLILKLIPHSTEIEEEIKILEYKLETL